MNGSRLGFGGLAPAAPLRFFSPNQFFADNGNLRRRGNAKPHPVAFDGDDGERYGAAGDDDPLAALPTKDEHVQSLLE
jgi:hypothetical protein